MFYLGPEKKCKISVNDYDYLGPLNQVPPIQGHFYPGGVKNFEFSDMFLGRGVILLLHIPRCKLYDVDHLFYTPLDLCFYIGQHVSYFSALNVYAENYPNRAMLLLKGK